MLWGPIRMENMKCTISVISSVQIPPSWGSEEEPIPTQGCMLLATLLKQLLGFGFLSHKADN